MVWRPDYVVERLRHRRARFVRRPAAGRQLPVGRHSGGAGGGRPAGDPGRLVDHLQPHRNDPPDVDFRTPRDDGGGALRPARRLCLAAHTGAGAASAGAAGGTPGRMPGRVLLRPARRIRGAGATHAVHAAGRRAGDGLGTGRRAQPHLVPRAAGRSADRPVGGAGGGLLAVLRRGRRAALCRFGGGRRVRRLARAHPQLGRRAVGGDAGLAAGSAAGLPAVFAGFAAGQRAGHPGRQLRRHAAGAARRRHSLVADRGAGACRARLADGLSRMVRDLAGLAGAGATAVGGGRRRPWRCRLPAAARHAGAAARRGAAAAGHLLAGRSDRPRAKPGSPYSMSARGWRRWCAPAITR